MLILSTARAIFPVAVQRSPKNSLFSFQGQVASVHTTSIFVFLLVDILRLLERHLRILEALIDSDLARHLERLEGVHGLINLTSVAEIRCLLDGLLHLGRVLVDENSQRLLSFLSLAISSLGLGIDDDLLGGHSLSRLLHNLLLEAAHLVVELHLLIVPDKHLRSHNLLLCLFWESLTRSLVEELVLETGLATKGRLQHGRVHKNWSALHEHSLLAFLPILVELGLGILVKSWVRNILHLIWVHEGRGHHLLLLLVVHVLRHLHLLLAVVLPKLLLAPDLEFLASVGKRASCAVRTIASSLVELALDRLVVVGSILEVALELHALAVEVLLVHHLVAPSAIAPGHILLHSSLILVVLLTLEIAASSAVVAHAVLLVATAHVPLLVVAPHVSILGSVVDGHPSHGS